METTALLRAFCDAVERRDGKILEYHEVANTAPAFVDMNFAPERIAKIFAKQGTALKARP